MEETNKKEYYPQDRFLMDIILITDVAILVLSAVSTSFFWGFILLGLALNFFQILLWFFWAKNTLKITVTDQKISGPAPRLSAETIPMLQVDKWKTESLNSRTRKKGFVDIWGRDGSRIRIFRSILGRAQCYAILETVLKGFGSYGDPGRQIIVPYPNE